MPAAKKTAAKKPAAKTDNSFSELLEVVKLQNAALKMCEFSDSSIKNTIADAEKLIKKIK